MIKRTPLDALISDLIREAADWTCERCGLVFPERKSQACHASHYISRSFVSTRYFIDNLSCLCAACHDAVGKDPGEHYRFVFGKLGEVRYDELRQRKQRVMRYRNHDRAAMRAHYKAELARVKDMRSKGVTGLIEVVSYD